MRISDWSSDVCSSDLIRLDLPEKVLQFGTGGFLRGFTDYLIERANKEHLFNGSVLVVKSTPGSAANFARQDNLYTLNIRDKDINEFIISAPISRVVSALEIGRASCRERVCQYV